MDLSIGTKLERNNLVGYVKLSLMPPYLAFRIEHFHKSIFKGISSNRWFDTRHEATTDITPYVQRYLQSVA